MKKCLLLIGVLILLTGCSGHMTEDEHKNAAGFINVYSSLDCFSDIYVYEKTDVMYAVNDCYYGGGMSVMLESDGKPMLWSNWKSYYESLGE